MDDPKLYFNDIQSIKDEEKRLNEEYKRKLFELKKIQIAKESVGQIFTKGLLPIYILYILTLGSANGNEISNKISKHTKGLWTPSTGGIYPILKKFEKEGLILGEWDDPEKKFQKIYKLTSKGKIEYQNRKSLLQPKIEESLMVFNIIYKDLYNSQSNK